MKIYIYLIMLALLASPAMAALQCDDATGEGAECTVCSGGAVAQGWTCTNNVCCPADDPTCLDTCGFVEPPQEPVCGDGQKHFTEACDLGEGNQCSEGTCNIELNCICEPDAPEGEAAPTTILIHDGNFHVCGQNWDLPAVTTVSGDLVGLTQMHDACTQINDVPNAYGIITNYTCAFDETGWKWFENAPPMSSSQDYWNTWAHPDWGIDASFVNAGAFECDGGSPALTVEKFSPPPSRTSLECLETRCYDPTPEEPGASVCAPVGRNNTHYTCTNVETKGAQWVSRLSYLGQQLIDDARDSKSTLNCGPQRLPQTGVNSYESDAGYCELINEDRDKITIGVLFDGEITDEKLLAFGEQVQLTRQAEATFPKLGDVLTDIDYLNSENFIDVDEDNGWATFTYPNRLDQRNGDNLWDWIKDLFSNYVVADSPTLKSYAAERIFAKDGKVWVAEYVELECTANNLLIIYPDSTTQCYTEQRWRNIQYGGNP